MRSKRARHHYIVMGRGETDHPVHVDIATAEVVAHDPREAERKATAMWREDPHRWNRTRVTMVYRHRMTREEREGYLTTPEARGLAGDAPWQRRRRR